MPIIREVYSALSVVNRRGVHLKTSICEIPQDDGTTLLSLTQEPLQSGRDDDHIVVDEAAQEQLYIHLSKKFGAR